MAHKRIEFTDKQKSIIYSRDRATCAFSGISLWIPDDGIRPNWDFDWVDHIKPSASGGDASLENGICASSIFNAKKRSNASDNVYFVHHGRITENYIRVFGNPSNKLLGQLNRLKKLNPIDWYFNRCIANTFIGFDWKCNVEFNNITKNRDDKYWFKSAFKRLSLFTNSPYRASFVDRGLVTDKSSFGSQYLLEAENISTESEYLYWAEHIFPIYRSNFNFYNSYFTSDDVDYRKQLIENTLNMNEINPNLLQAINSHFEANKD